VCRRRASNVEPSLTSPFSASHSTIIGGDDISTGFCLSVGRHSRGVSLSLRPQQQQQRPFVGVVVPTADASPRQPSPSNVADDQPSRYTIYQPLLATGRNTPQQLYQPLLVSPSASPSRMSVRLFALQVTDLSKKRIEC